MAKNKIKWLDRRVSAPSPYLCLCLSEKEFKRALKHCNITTDTDWAGGSFGCCHTFKNENGDLVCIICIKDHQKQTPIEIAGLLVHESVHVAQQYFDSIGEMSPASEQQAYAIQMLPQELMEEFARRLNEPK